MPAKTPISDQGLLFGSDSLYEVLKALAGQRDKRFHGSALARETGRSRKTALGELEKLKKLGVVESVGLKGRRKELRVSDNKLAGALLALPALIDSQLQGKRKGQHH